MTHTLSQTTRTVPNSGAKTAPTPAATHSHPLVLAGLIQWLPSLAILIGMPLLALGTTKYFLLPAMKQVFAQEAALNGESAAGQYTKPVFLVRIPLNVSGARGAHSGFRSLALVGADNAFKEKIAQNQAMLANLAARDLRGKTMSDLDKPGELDALRAGLLADFNHALGKPVVKELYISVWP